MVVGEDSEVTDLRRILSAAMDLTILALTVILHFGITDSITMAGFSTIAMISSSGTISSSVLTSQRSDTPGGGIPITIGILILMATMTTRIPITTNHHRIVATRHRMELNTGAI